MRCGVFKSLKFVWRVHRCVGEWLSVCVCEGRVVTCYMIPYCVLYIVVLSYFVCSPGEPRVDPC